MADTGYGEGLLYLLDVEEGELDQRKSEHLSGLSIVQHNKGRDERALTSYVVGFTRGVGERSVSFEEANSWASRPYFEVNLATGLNVPEVV